MRRSRATGYSVLTFVALFALLPPTLAVPQAVSAGPFVDFTPVHSPALAAMKTRQSLVSGLTAVTTPSMAPASVAATAAAAAPQPAVKIAPAAPTQQALPAMEARRVLRWSTASSAAAPRKSTTAASAQSVSSPPAAASRRYRVTSGDTLWTIAGRMGVSVEGIAAANGMASPHMLRIGQVLTVPSGDGTAIAPAQRRPTTASTARSARTASVAYRVQNGDTLYALARRYGTSVGAIVAANDLPSAHRLKIGQRLTVPLATGGGSAAARELTTTRSALSAPAVSAGLVWPARGLLTSRYGWRHRRHHDGIDVAAPRGSPIYAVRDGRVVFAGWYYGYGRAVIVSHGDGMTTLYGHASSLLVRTGEMVKRGQVIARVGCTGNCTGFHVHFEVRVNGRAVNPLRYLN